jgi:hypothetical protein
VSLCRVDLPRMPGEHKGGKPFKDGRVAVVNDKRYESPVSQAMTPAQLIARCSVCKRKRENAVLPFEQRKKVRAAHTCGGYGMAVPHYKCGPR